MPRQRRTATLATILSIAGLAAASLTPAVIAPVDADHSSSSGGTSLLLACRPILGQPADRCVDVHHKSPPGVHAWSATGEREVTLGGSTLAGNPVFSFDETYDGDALRKLTIRGHASVTQSGGGTASASANYQMRFVGSGTDMSVSGSVSFLATGSHLINANGRARVVITCGAQEPLQYEAQGAAGAGEPVSFAASAPVSGTLPTGVDVCDIKVDVSAFSGTNQPAAADQTGSADAKVELTISLGPGASPTPDVCSLSGEVSDTGGVERAGHPLAGVRVELLASLANGGPSLAAPVATDADGAFCFRLPAGVPSGDATLRATLIDATHTPPLFETRHGTETVPVFVERSVRPTDVGRDDFDVTFVPTSDRPWLADVATIHYESERFVRWLLDDLEVAPGLLGSFIIETGSSKGTSYRVSSRTVFIQETDTPFTDRDSAFSECPENCEWHEIAHHLGDAVGIAPTATAAECEGRTSHGGWSNATTCDSVAEGFASFLATLASLDIDAGRVGYGTPEYSTLANLEDNDEMAWTTATANDGRTLFREDHAVAKLLWDLADAGTVEGELLEIEDPAGSSDVLAIADLVSLGGNELVHLLIAAQPVTVVDLYEALAASPGVPADLKVRNPSLRDELTQDITPLQEAFLLHGFFPVHDPANPRYRLGDPIPRTDHVPGTSGGLLSRRHIEELPGSEIRLVNPGNAPVTFSIDVAYSSTKSHFDVVVPANGERLVHREVPPYWPHFLPPGATLPACDGPKQRTVTITVSSPGATPTTIDSCDYLHAVATTTTGWAMSYSVAERGSASMPTLLIVGIVAAATLILIGGLVLVRRRQGLGGGPTR